jgi:signal transduction histidine kinase
MVRNIAEAHGGQATAAGVLGRGSVFTLRIPLREAEFFGC